MPNCGRGRQCSGRPPSSPAPWWFCSPIRANTPASGPATAGSTAGTTGELRQLTIDHSRVQELVDAGLLAPEAAGGHPEAHIVPRALGGGPLPIVALPR